MTENRTEPWPIPTLVLNDGEEKPFYVYIVE